MVSITEQQLAANIKSVESSRRKFQRPGPVRGLRFVNGSITWEKPVDASWNVTSYRVYANNENTLVNEVPVSQTSVTAVSAQRVFVSAYNNDSALESIKLLLNGPIYTPSTALSIGAFGIGAGGSLLTQDGFTWTDNSPVAGQIAWGAGGVITYKGVKYTIAAGNSGGFNYVVWNKATPNVFSSQNVPVTLGPDDFVIAKNFVGTYQPAITFATGNNPGTGLHRIVAFPDTIELFNSTGYVPISINSQGDVGTVTVYNNVMGGGIILSGATARIVFPGSGAPAAGKTLAGYIPVVNANGTDYWMAVYT